VEDDGCCADNAEEEDELLEREDRKESAACCDTGADDPTEAESETGNEAEVTEERVGMLEVEEEEIDEPEEGTEGTIWGAVESFGVRDD